MTSTKKYKKVPQIVQTSAINFKEKTRDIEENSLCQLMCNMNIAESNYTKCTLIYGLTNANWKIVGVHEDNFDTVIAYYTARKLIEPTWINCKDEYMTPNTEHSQYIPFINDALVYTLFNTASNFSTVRCFKYNDREWNNINEFFWMSVKDIEQLAGGAFGTDDINTAIEDDIEAFGKERFVYKKLQTVTLSPDAQAVLDKATELVKSSFYRRKQFNQAHPEYHINTWDAGWYQIKGLLKEYDPEGLKQFNELYKQLEDRMRPFVYELGFLYK